MLKIDLGLTRAYQFAQDAIARGGRLLRPGNGSKQDPTLIAWDVASRCEEPVTMYLHGTVHKDRELGVTYAGLRSMPPHVMTELSVRCRQCDPCLRYRGSMWAHRAIVETAAAPRTWKVTLTFSPAEHWRISCEAGAEQPGGLPLDADKRLLARHGVAGKLVTRFLKRLRAGGWYYTWDSRLRKKVPHHQPKTRFRYMVVMERHDGKRRLLNGVEGEALPPDSPHYHLLIHEISGQEPLRQAFIQQEWSIHGWSEVKLVGDDPTDQVQAAWYAAKYVSKEMLARVRGSIGYGKLRDFGIAQYEVAGRPPLADRPTGTNGVNSPDRLRQRVGDDPPPIFRVAERFGCEGQPSVHDEPRTTERGGGLVTTGPPL